jgi:hypothetical protein
VAGSVEVALAWGGDFQINALGDLVLAQDTPTSPAATTQRMIQLILTNPRLLDGNGNPIGRADDLFHPDYGAGLNRDVGELGTAGILADLVARIQAGIALDPGIAAFPAPVVTAVISTPGTALVNVSVTTVTGQYVPVPTQALQIFSS